MNNTPDPTPTAQATGSGLRPERSTGETIRDRILNTLREHGPTPFCYLARHVAGYDHDMDQMMFACARIKQIADAGEIVIDPRGQPEDIEVMVWIPKQIVPESAEWNAAKARCLQEFEDLNDPPCHPGDEDWRPCWFCDGSRSPNPH